MNVPGSNLLNRALNYIAKQTVEYLSFDQNVVKADGSKAPVYKAPVLLQGSFQPVSTTRKQYLGLEMSENYANFYCSANILPVERNKASDRIRFAGKLFQVVSETDWFHVDGWKDVLVVEAK